MEKKRITTAKTRIKNITSGQFLKQEGYNPSYVIANNGQRLSRVRILATVVDKFSSDGGKFSAITLDDSTDTIRAKVFNSLILQEISEGEIVDVIGRIKEYNGEIYLAPEIITKSDLSFGMLRELELRKQDIRLKKIYELIHQYKTQTTDVAELSRIMKERYGVEEELTETMLNLPETVAKEDVSNSKEMVLKLIGTIDTGQGCDYAELLETSKLSEETMDSIINELLTEGSCFEPKPGKIKKL